MEGVLKGLQGKTITKDSLFDFLISLDLQKLQKDVNSKNDTSTAAAGQTELEDESRNSKNNLESTVSSRRLKNIMNVLVIDDTEVDKGVAPEDKSGVVNSGLSEPSQLESETSESVSSQTDPVQSVTSVSESVEQEEIKELPVSESVEIVVQQEDIKEQPRVEPVEEQEATDKQAHEPSKVQLFLMQHIIPGLETTPKPELKESNIIINEPTFTISPFDSAPFSTTILEFPTEKLPDNSDKIHDQIAAIFSNVPESLHIKKPNMKYNKRTKQTRILKHPSDIECKACLKTFTEIGSLRRHYNRSPECIELIALGENNKEVKLTDGLSFIINALVIKAISNDEKLECKFCKEKFTRRCNHFKHYSNSSVCNRLAYYEFKKLFENM